MRQTSLFELGERIAGIDEAGRGPLAGPVVAAAVILRPDRPIEGLADSKQLTAGKRADYASRIREQALAVGVAWADAAEIDTLNILGATMLAMRRAVLNLPVLATGAQVDGNRLPDLQFGDRLLPGEAVVGGDAKVAAISAASIIAKVTRDAIMLQMDRLYPEYGFARHKGYATALHRERLRCNGPCDQHRRSFAPVRLCA